MPLNEASSEAPESCPGKASKVEEIILQQGMYVSTTSGVSMYPMLRDRKDTVVVTPCSGRLRKYDVPLYRRGEQYVLHRIIKVLPDSYVIRGDNCMLSEHGITDGDIIGVLSGFYRGKRQVRMDGFAYRAYIRACILSYPIRYVYYRIKAVAAGIIRRPKKAQSSQHGRTNGDHHV